MTNTQFNRPQHNANSAGSAASGARELDSHYLLARKEYDACIASVGIQPGWRVLDAGGGTGTFLPHLADLVGHGGSVTLIDHAAESVDYTRTWMAANRPQTKFEAHTGSVSKLPFDDMSFDCVWCANVIVYLSDQGYIDMLSEFVRVLKPGGLLAIKDMHYGLLNLHPIPRPLVDRLRAGLGDFSAGGIRISYVGADMRARGLSNIKGVSTFIERTAPFDPSWVPYLANQQRTYAVFAQQLDVSEADKAVWADIAANIEATLTDPDARYSEVFMLFVGQK